MSVNKLLRYLMSERSQLLELSFIIFFALNVLSIAPITIRDSVGQTNIPLYINYQGAISGSLSGSSFQGPVDIKIDIYDSETDGTLLYQELHPNVTLDSGVYSLRLGSGSGQQPLGGFADAFSGSVGKWLQTTVNGEILLPRQPIDSVAFTFYAGHAETADIAKGLQGLSELPSQIITLNTLLSAFSSQVPEVSESQIPPSIARQTELAAESQVRTVSDDILQDQNENLSIRISALESSLASKLKYGGARVEVLPGTMRSIRCSCPKSSTPLTADFRSSADSQHSIYASQAFFNPSTESHGWQIDYGNTGNISHVVYVTVICLQ